MASTSHFIGSGIKSRQDLDAIPGMTVAPSSKRQAAIARRDIRKHIAATPQNDPNNFPQLDYQRYPLMILDPNNKPYVDVQNRPILVYNMEEEEQFRAEHPEAKPFEDPRNPQDEIAELRAEVARLKAKNGEAVEGDEPPAAEAAPVKPKNGVAGLARDKAHPAKVQTPKPGSKLED